MEFLQLRYFYETAQNENIAKTAEKFMVPASSVSASIKRLEKELGADLFIRSSNKIKLNEKGHSFFESLGTIFEKLDSAITCITEEKAQPKEIYLLIKARRKWITELIIEYKKAHQNAQFRIFNDVHTNNIEDFDVIIDEQSDTYSMWEQFLLSTEQIVIKASKNSSLVGKALTFRDLKDESFIMPRKDIGIRKLLEGIGKKHGFEPKITIECNDSYCLSRYVESGMGLTLGSGRALQDDIEKNIVALDVIGFNEVQLVYVYHRKLNANDEAIRNFCDFLYDNRQNIKKD